MAGATSNHATFSITRQRWTVFQGPSTRKDYKLSGPNPDLRILYGTCGNSLITLGVTDPNRAEYDLCDPESISKITEHIHRVLEE